MREIIVIGVEKYSKDSLLSPLNYAGDDAREIAQLVLTQRPPGTPPGLQSALGGDAVEMLPPFARTMLGLTRPGLAALPARAATWGMGKTLRWAFKQN